MTSKAPSPDEIMARISRRVEHRIIVEADFTDAPTANRLTTDVVDWLMLRAPRKKFELCSLKIAILQALDQGRAQSGEYVVYSGNGTAVVCSERSALLLLGYERIQELLRYLDYEQEGASRTPWDDLVVNSLTAVQDAKPNPKGTRKPHKSAKA